MNETWKRYLSLFLAVVMCISIFPVSAFAEGENGEDVEPAAEAVEEIAVPQPEQASVPEYPAEELPCTHAYVDAVTVPTCTAQGFTTHTCTICGDTYVDTYTDPLGHSPVDVAEVPATEEAEGTTAGKVCAVCGAVLEGCEVIPVKEHTHEFYLVAATDTLKEHYECTGCDKLFVLQNGEYVEVSRDSLAIEKTEEPSFKSSAEVADSNGVVITVSAEAGIIPEGTTVSARLIKSSANEAEAIDDAVDAARDENKNIAASYTFDIKLMLNGEEIAPNGPVSVMFSMGEKKPAFVNVDVYHVDDAATQVVKIFKEAKNEVTIKNGSATEIQKAETEASIKTESFSYYVVEFTYDELQYALEGNTAVELSAILTDLGISGSVVSAVSDAPELFDVEEGKVYAKQAFETQQKLTVGMADGTNYKITITNAETDSNTASFNADDATSGTCGDNATWVLDSDGVLTISGTGTIKDYSSNSVGNLPPWNSNKLSIKHIEIENGITGIGESAFSGCSSFTSINIPKSVTSIGDGAFANCESLTSITINTSRVTSIGYRAFADCTNLKKVTFIGRCPEFSPNYTENNCFNNDVLTVYYPSDSKWVAIRTYSLGGTVTWVEYVPTASGTCGDNITWTLDDTGTLTISGTGAMEDYDGYDDKNVPWYDYKNNIKSVNISNGITTIGNGTFFDCQNLKKIEIPNSVTSIGSYAFYVNYYSWTYDEYLTSLTSITIPSSVKSIGYKAFSDCEKLEKVYFEGDAPSFSEYSFNRCYHITAFYPADNSTWTKEVMQDYGGRITWKQRLDCLKIVSAEFVQTNERFTLRYKLYNEEESDLQNIEVVIKPEDDNFSFPEELYGDITSLTQTFETVEAGAVKDGSVELCAGENETHATVIIELYSDSELLSYSKKTITIVEGEEGVDISGGLYASWPATETIYDIVDYRSKEFKPGDFSFSYTNADYEELEDVSYRIILPEDESISVPSDMQTEESWGTLASGETKEIEGTLIFQGDSQFKTSEVKIQILSGDEVVEELCKEIVIPKDPTGLFSREANGFGFMNLGLNTPFELLSEHFGNTVYYFPAEFSSYIIAEIASEGGVCYGIATYTSKLWAGKETLPEKYYGMRPVDITFKTIQYKDDELLTQIKRYNLLQFPTIYAFQYKLISGIKSELIGLSSQNAEKIVAELKNCSDPVTLSFTKQDGSHAVNFDPSKGVVEEPDGTIRIYIYDNEIPVISRSNGEIVYDHPELYLIYSNGKLYQKPLDGKESEIIAMSIIPESEVDTLGPYDKSAYNTASFNAAEDETSGNVSQIYVPLNNPFTITAEDGSGSITYSNGELAASGDAACQRFIGADSLAAVYITGNYTITGLTEFSAFHGNSAFSAENLNGSAVYVDITNNTMNLSGATNENSAVAIGDYSDSDYNKIELQGKLEGEDPTLCYSPDSKTVRLEGMDESAAVTVVYASDATSEDGVKETTTVAELNGSNIREKGVELAELLSGSVSVNFTEDYYLLSKSSDSIKVNAAVSPAKLNSYVEWSVENADANNSDVIIEVDNEGNVTPVSVGTAYAVASITAGDKVCSARCRIDVVEDDGSETPVANKVQSAALTDLKATTELYKTTYTQIPVLLVMEQNAQNPEQTDSLKTGSVAALNAAPEGNGSAIESARFADEATAQMFSLRPVDDRTLEIIPTDYALEQDQIKASNVKTSYTSKIIVTVDGKEFICTTTDGKNTEQLLTLTVRKTKPAVKAAAVKLNSYIPLHSAVLNFTGGSVTAIEVDTGKNTAKTTAVPSWLTVDESTFKVALNESTAAKSASGKLYLLATVDGWAVKQAITVSVSAANTAPKLTFKPSSVSVLSGTEDEAVAAYTLSAKEFADYPLSISRITEGTAVRTEEELQNVITFQIADGKLIVSAVKEAETLKDRTFKVYLKLGVTGREKEYPVTVKLLRNATKTTLNVKQTGAIDTSVPNSPIVLTASLSSYHSNGVNYSLNIMRYKAATKTTPLINEDVTDLFNVTEKNGTFTITAEEATKDQMASGYTYNAVVTASFAGSRAAETKTVKMNMKWSKPTAVAPSVTLKASGSIDVLRPGTAVTLTPVFKNWYNYVPNCENVTITRTYTVKENGRSVTKQDDVTSWFNVALNEAETAFVITAAGTENISHKEKFTVCFDPGTITNNGIEYSKLSKKTTLSIKQGTVKYALDPAADTLYAKDRYSSIQFSIITTDETLAATGIKSVQLDAASAKLFELKDLGGGQYMLSYLNNRLPEGKLTVKAGQSKSVKLAVILEGNNTTTANTTLTLKVNIK